MDALAYEHNLLQDIGNGNLQSIFLSLIDAAQKHSEGEVRRCIDGVFSELTSAPSAGRCVPRMLIERILADAGVSEWALQADRPDDMRQLCDTIPQFSPAPRCPVRGNGMSCPSDAASVPAPAAPWPTLRDHLPAIWDAADFLAAVFPKPQSVLEGFLDVSCKMLITGPSKTMKSFFAQQLAIWISLGGEFFNWVVPEPLRTALLQFENPEYHFRERLKGQLQGLGIPEERLRSRLFVTTLNARDLNRDPLEGLLWIVKQCEAQVLILDPLYKLLLGNENSCEDVGAVLETFDEVIAQTGVALIYVHHTTKGIAGDRQAIDRGAGTGWIARDYHASLNLAPHRDSGLTVCEPICRCYPPTEPFSLRWDSDRQIFAISDAAPQLLTSATRGKGKIWKSPTTDEQVVHASTPPRSKTAYQHFLRSHFGFTDRDAKAKMDELLGTGQLAEVREKGKSGPATQVGTPEAIAALEQQWEDKE